MKKTLLIAAVAALALGANLWGQTITVTSPTAGNEWCQGTSHQITWTSSGVAGPLSIKLRPADQPMADPVLEIVASTANDGVFAWAIPASCPVGDYEVRVRTVSESPLIYGDSGNFKVKVCAAPGGSITVTSPTAGSNWETGSTYTITWTSPDVAGPMSIKLRKAGEPMADPVLEISASTADDGSFSWTIPGSVVAGNYLVRVRTVSNSPLVYGDSPDFHIGGEFVFPHDWWKRKYLVVRWPIGPDPCLCPEWNIKELLERLKEVGPRFVGSIGLLRNGAKIQELGQLGGRRLLGDTLKPTLSRNDFDAFKNGTAKFSMGIFNAKGKLVQEIQLQGEQEQLR